MNPVNLAKLLYSEEIVRRLRNDLKEQTGIYFQVEDVADSLREIIANKVEFPKPRLRVKKKPITKSKPTIDKIVET